MPPKKRTVKTAVKKPARKTKPPVKKRSKRLVPAVTAAPTEARVEESKFYAGPVIQKFAEERPFEFPAGYGDNRIVLMVRDPHWLFVYWEVQGNGRWLRVYDTSNWKFHDIEIAAGAKNWYIHVPFCNRTYCVEIGYKTANGEFVALARSNFVTTPLDAMSDIIDEQWLIPDWDKLYSLSGGFGLGRSSGEIRELLKKQPGSGWLFSPSSPARKMGPRPFWLTANCELIVYGATEPTATVTIQGRKINLRADGTFSLRFALPDGEQTIPIEAIRDDGAERRKITPKVERKTDPASAGK